MLSKIGLPTGLPQEALTSVKKGITNTKNFVKDYAFIPTANLANRSTTAINAKVINPLAVRVKKVASSVSYLKFDSINIDKQKLKKPVAIVAATLLTAGLLYGTSQAIGKYAASTFEELNATPVYDELENISKEGTSWNDWIWENKIYIMATEFVTGASFLFCMSALTGRRIEIAEAVDMGIYNIREALYL